MIWDLTNFMLIGLLLGVAVRFVVATDRHRAPVAMGLTMVPGVIGALLGGMASWFLWPSDNGIFHFGGVGTAILGFRWRRGTLG